MSRVARILYDPQDPKSVSEHASRVQRVVDGQIEFGSPQNPNDPQSTTVADGVTHNGILQNMLGAWVEILVDTAPGLAANITCTHNLGVPIVNASTPNVRWLVFGWQHNAAGTGATSTVSVVYEGGTVAENSIVLRFYANARTVNDANPLKCTLFFVPAVR